MERPTERQSSRPSPHPLVFRWLVAAILVLASAATTTAGEAQRRRGGPRVIQLDEIRIEGRVQKPNAFYILNRSNLGYEVLDLRTSFLNNIVESVQDEPF